MSRPPCASWEASRVPGAGARGSCVRGARPSAEVDGRALSARRMLRPARGRPFTRPAGPRHGASSRAGGDARPPHRRLRRRHGRRMWTCGAVAETPGFVMCRTPHGTVATNMAIVTGRIDAPTIRARTRAFYGPTGSPFSVWTREHADRGLEAELGALGFHPIHREPGMTFLPGAGRPAPPPPEATIRPVTDDAGRADYTRIMTRAFALYGAPEASTAEHFARLAGLVGP